MVIKCLSCRRYLNARPLPYADFVQVKCKSCGCSMRLETTSDNIFVLTRDGKFEPDNDGDLLDGPFVHIGAIYDCSEIPAYEPASSAADWLIKKHKSLPPDQQVRNLRKALENMESRQEFEDCALIRDRLKELEKR